MDTFPRVPFAYFASRNQWSASYIKEAMVLNGSQNSGQKIQENEQITGFLGTLFKSHNNLFVFPNFLTRENHEICVLWLSTFMKT